MTLAAELESPAAAVDDPRPVARGEIRARRRPLAIAATLATTLVSAWLVATPIHAWAKRVWGAHPLGDEVLFRAGGRELLTWLGEGDAAIAVALSSAFTLLLVGVGVTNVVFGALVASLSTEGGRRSDPVRVGFAAFIPVAGASIAAGAMQLAIVALGLFGGSAAAHFVEPRWGDAAGFDARVAVVVLALAVAAVVGIAADLARVEIARDVAVAPGRVTALRRIGAAARSALGTMRRRTGRVALDWSVRAAGSIAALAIAFALGSLFGARGGGALFALFVLRQVLVGVRVALRASWLACALRLGGG